MDPAALRSLLARASPARSGDELAGTAAASRSDRVTAQRELAATGLADILATPIIDPDDDDVSGLILDQHDPGAFRALSTWSVGQLRDWLLSDEVGDAELATVTWGLTPEMVAAVAKVCRNQDLVAIAAKRHVVTRFRTTVGLPGRLSVRIQPNHPTDDPRGIAASIVDGLRMGCGDAVVGINPATDSPAAMRRLLDLVEGFRIETDCPIQSCVLAHVTTAIDVLEDGAPVDLVFQSVAGSQAANAAFGVTLELLAEANEAARSLRRGSVGDNVMYFETGQGSALSADAHHDVDQQTMEARAYAVARAFEPMLVNSVVGFIGPEYLYDGKQITRAGLEDHMCGKLLGLPMGVDVCHTNHAEADADDLDVLLTMLGVAGVNFVMGVPGGDDIMLGYQTTSYHDAAWARRVLDLRPAPEFEAWLAAMGIMDGDGILMASDHALDGVVAQLAPSGLVAPP